MKHLSPIFLILIIFTSLIPIQFAHGANSSFNNIVNTTSTIAENLGATANSRSFFSGDRWYSLLCDSAGAQRFYYSTDLTTWTATTTLTNSGCTGAQKNMPLWYNGTHVFVAYEDTNGHVNYSRCVPNGATLTCSDNKRSYSSNKVGAIITNSNHVPFIVNSSTTTSTFGLWRGEVNNVSAWTNVGTLCTSCSFNDNRGAIANLTSGRLLFIFSNSAGTLSFYRIYFYNNNSFSPTLFFASAELNSGNCITDRDSNAHCVYVLNSQSYYRNFTYSTQTWSTPVLTISASSVVLTHIARGVNGYEFIIVSWRSGAGNTRFMYYNLTSAYGRFVDDGIVPTIDYQLTQQQVQALSLTWGVSPSSSGLYPNAIGILAVNRTGATNCTPTACNQRFMAWAPTWTTVSPFPSGGNVSSNLDLIAIDRNNNTRLRYANGESFKLNAYLFQQGGVFAGINNQKVEFQRLDGTTWTPIAVSLTGRVDNQDGIAETYVIQFDKQIGQITQYRAVYEGNANFTSSTSDTIDITTTSIFEIPGRIPTALTLDPLRRVVNVNQGGVSESLEVNYEFGLDQNWRLRSILYKFENEGYTPLQGQLLKFYIKKNNVGDYYNFANATTDANGVGLTNWYGFDSTWSGRSNIKVLFSGSYDYSSSNSTSLIIAINSQTLRLTINLNNNVTNPSSSLTINGFLTRNSTVSNANVTTAIPNEKVRIWLNSTTIPFRLLSDSTYTNPNGEYTLTFSVPALSGTYFIKANATVSLYNANVQSRTLGFSVRSISVDAEPDLSPGVELDDIFIAPMDTCSNKLVCGFVFWIIFLAIFEIMFFMVASKLDFKGEFVGAGAIGMFLASVPIGIAFTWLPPTMIIIAVIPVALMMWGVFRKVQGNN